ncbi:MAG: hypothetical protein DA408_03545 [Bacteroidetes bacterium]|nr:MAG: hypothetical protein DA408_03545 [Bacteroidota bacterium]
MSWRFCLVGTLSLLLFACLRKDKTAPATPCQEFIFLGHPYDWYTENSLDPRLELLDFSRYAGVWLGGDVCGRTSKSEATLQYLDHIFGLTQQTTHWAWGNHDLLEGDEALLRQATGRGDYYTTRQDGLQIIVLNTNLFWHNAWTPPATDCARKAAQIQWLTTVLDTIKSASQLVILHHHGLLNEDKRNFQGDTLRPDNVTGMPVRPDCRATGDFSAEIRPSLVQLQQRGIQVTLVGGDVGMNSKGYQFTTPEGIHLLGSGINNSLDMADPAPYITNFHPDSVLVFRYCPTAGSLDWHFLRLRDVVEEQLSPAARSQLSDRVKVLLEQF